MHVTDSSSEFRFDFFLPRLKVDSRRAQDGVVSKVEEYSHTTTMSATTKIPASSTSSANDICVVTFNVWFGRNARGSPHPRERMKALVDSFRAQKPHLVGFQEVIPELAKTLLQELESDYDFFQQPGAEHYGCAIACRKDVRVVQPCVWISYPNSSMNRGFLSVIVNFNGMNVRF